MNVWRGGRLFVSRPVEIIPDVHGYAVPSDALVTCRCAVRLSVPSATLDCPGWYHSSSWLPAFVHPPLFQS